MTHTKLISSVLALGALGAFSLAYANPAEHFNEIDADGSGTISEAEFVTYKTTQHDYSVEDATAKFIDWAGEDNQLTLVEFGEALEAEHGRNCRDKVDQSA